MRIRGGLRSVVWMFESKDGAVHFGTRVAPLQDELVEVQRKKEWSPSSLVPALLTDILYNASFKLNMFLSCFWCCFRVWKRAHRLFGDSRLLRCKLIVPHYSHLSTHRLSPLVFMYFPVVPNISFNSNQLIFVIIPLQPNVFLFCFFVGMKDFICRNAFGFFLFLFFSFYVGCEVKSMC